MLEYGKVVEVSEELAGSSLAGDVAAGAILLPVVEASDFDERGGQLSINGETLAYSTVNMESDVITLDAVTPLTAAGAEGDMVAIYPDAPIRSALVELEYAGDAVLVRVPHHLSAMLPLGIREAEQQESVTIDRSSAMWVIQDVIGRPATVQGAAVDVSTMDPIENISPDYTYPGDIPMTNVTGGQISSVFETPDVGSGKMRISDIFGLQSLRSDGSARFDLPNSDDRAISIDAEIITNRFTSLDEFALRGVNNEIAKDAVVTLQRGTTQPITPPSVSISWDSIGVDDPLNLSQYWYGLAWVSSTSAWYVVDTFGANGALAQFNPTTGAPVGLSYSVGVEPLGGVTYLGGNLYVLGSRTSGQFGQIVKWYVERYNTSGTKLGEWQYLPPAGATKRPGIGTDGANIQIGQVSSAGQLLWNFYNPTTGAWTGATTFGPTVGNVHVSSIMQGTFDLGTSRTVVAFDGLAQPAVRVYSNDGSSYVSANSWPAAASSTIAGLAWDGASFRSLARGAARLFTYSAITNTANPWWVGNTWRRSDATGPDFAQYETKLGGARKFTMTRRANLTVSTAPIPSGAAGPDAADSMTLYLGTGAAQPTNANFFRRATPAAGVTSVLFSTMDFTGGNPPTAGTFPNANPARIISDDPALLTIDGNGSITAPKKMQCGTLTVPVSAAAAGSTSLVFPVPFAVAPALTVTTGGGATQYYPVHSAKSATSATITVVHRAGTSATTTVTVDWIAMVP